MDQKKSEDKAITKIRKPYEKPSATKLSPEQTKLKLLGAGSEGHQGAKDLLELMFPDLQPKKSA